MTRTTRRAAFAFTLTAWLVAGVPQAAADIIVVCGPAAPDGKECCPVMAQIYWRDFGQPPRRDGPDRADRRKLRAWYNENCVGPRRPPLPSEP